MTCFSCGEVVGEGLGLVCGLCLDDADDTAKVADAAQLREMGLDLPAHDLDPKALFVVTTFPEDPGFGYLSRGAKSYGEFSADPAKLDALPTLADQVDC